MEHFYYADRPSVPSTQHNVVHLGSILEHSIVLNLDNVVNSFFANAVEVKNEDGEIMGTLLWVGGITYATLVAPAEPESDITENVNSTLT